MKKKDLSRVFNAIRFLIIRNTYRGWITAGMKVLDIGCGTGFIGKWFQESLEVKVTGTDIANFLDISLPFVIMPDCKTLSFKDDEFDCAMLNCTLHHVQDYEALLNEALRVAKTVLIFEVEHNLSLKIIDWVANKWFFNNESPLLHTFNFLQWKEKFRKYNYEYRIVKIRVVSKQFAFKISRLNKGDSPIFCTAGSAGEEKKSIK